MDPKQVIVDSAKNIDNVDIDELKLLSDQQFNSSELLLTSLNILNGMRIEESINNTNSGNSNMDIDKKIFEIIGKYIKGLFLQSIFKNWQNYLYLQGVIPI